MKRIVPLPVSLLAVSLLPVSLLAGCLSDAPEGLHPVEQARTHVKMDFLHRPLPEIPLPNDLATRFDPTSATGRRINASMVAPTASERRVRALIDQLDGWGVQQPITIPFSGPIDVGTIVDLDGKHRLHSDPHFDFTDDVVYLIDIDPQSPHFGQLQHLDVGQGNYPVVLEDLDAYQKNDVRGWTLSLSFEEEDEDLNGNGVLDPGEDTDADGVLDKPNYLPGRAPARDDLAGRADALMSFYDRETDTLILRPMLPLRERTTYAVVVTRRIRDAHGDPIGSPFPHVNHPAQDAALARLPEVLPPWLGMKDVAFAFTFTTQSLQAHWIAVRDGLYGYGVQGHLGRDFPPEIELEVLRDPAVPRFSRVDVPYIMPTETFLPPLQLIAAGLLGLEPGSEQFQRLLNSHKYIDYQVVGSFESPQLFERYDANGDFLPLDAQSWPPDLDRRPAKARAETVYFWLTVPRPEVSPRGKGRPAPVVIYGHGHGSNRLETASFAGFFAQHGFATLAIDCVSHGVGVAEDEIAELRPIIENSGLANLIDAVFKGRALDQDGDGIADSGADFWTSYVFHTRDVVRQCALDHMQLIRILRTFDGKRRWKHDVNRDGEPELAGDFDADGRVDVGQGSRLVMAGGSLGGIMSSLLGGLEPELEAIVPISGGAGLGDVGIRSTQGAVKRAVILRLMSPLYVATVDSATGDTLVETIVPDLTTERTLPIATVRGRVVPGDTMLVENLDNGQVGCGYVQPDGRARVSVESDLHDRTRLRFFSGRQLVTGSTDCELVKGAEASVTLDTFETPVEFQGRTFEAGAPLVALAEGMGMKRATPSLRRFIGLAQLVLDAGDPGTYARHLLQEPLVYPGTGQETATHALVVTTMGDMVVPASSGLTFGRAAGIIDFLKNHPGYRVPANQAVLDTYTAEAVHTYRRYTDPDGNGVHLDVEDFAGGGDLYGDRIPRLDPPLRIGFDREDPLGGRSAAIFPYTIPTGLHGFQLPGQMLDDLRKQCTAGCPEGESCGCRDLQGFDIGTFMFNMLGRYLVTGGRELTADLCHARGDCAYTKPVPPTRR